MDHNYTVVIIICILSMIFLAIDVGKNSILNKNEVKWFRITFILAALGAFCEYMGVLFDNLDNSPAKLHWIITFVEFSISPFLAVCLAHSSLMNLKVKPILVVLAGNVITQIVSLFTGIIFFIDSNGTFVRGQFYWIYLIFCGISFIYILYVFVLIGIKSHLRNILCLILIVSIVTIGQLANAINGKINSGYASICVTATLLYIFIQNMFRYMMMETIDREKNISNHDALTKVMSRVSFDNRAREFDNKIAEKSENLNFAVCECDLNNLKLVNDTFGHDAGDQYIIRCCKTICDFFKHSPVFRIGGDEFIIIIQNEDYINLEQIKKAVKNFSIEEIKKDIPLNEKRSFAAGFAVFDYNKHFSFSDVLKKADIDMYKNKAMLKDLSKNKK